ncbi:hypothetical protein [Lactiplantibacillus plajomi]|uniref:Uncharacterized protein n=1 Tax=Lactiplantibacillus plajomi TaxID=1457217 RepID=A0ABV6K1Q5_9LACO
MKWREVNEKWLKSTGGSEIEHVINRQLDFDIATGLNHYQDGYLSAPESRI